MINRRLLWLAIVCISPLPSGAICCATTSPPAEVALESTPEGINTHCPVMPEMEGSPEITLHYQGHEVRFCCTGCRREFLAAPDKYLANLPQIARPRLAARVWSFPAEHPDLMLIASLALGLVWLRIARGRWSAEQAGAETTGIVASLTTKTVRPTFPLLLLLMFAGYEINALDSALFFQVLEEDIHFATFSDYGSPPVPTPPQHERRLAGTYYRGNDERSPVLVNGGNYRTATFHIALVDDQDRPLTYGQQLSPGRVLLRLRIDRTQFTPDFLYSDRFMNAIFLTRQATPSLGRTAEVGDRVPLNETEPMWQWEARYPITVSAAADAEYEGIVYVCEDKFYQPHRFAEKDAVGGARFHYGMPYRLVLEDGQVAATSELSMGSLYRTRKFPVHEVPLDQWFSEHPIPELTEPNTDDPALLGIEDYLSP